MKAYQLTIAAAAAGLLLATGPASATPLAPASPAPLGLDQFDGSVEPVHYRPYRPVRRHYRPHYWTPGITFGLAPFATPYYAYPYRHYGPHYPTRYPYAHSYGYGFAPTFSFGFHVR